MFMRQMIDVDIIIFHIMKVLGAIYCNWILDKNRKIGKKLNKYNINTTNGPAIIVLGSKSRGRQFDSRLCLPQPIQ